MIFSVCIQIFLVSSLFLERIMSASSMKRQWSINVSEVNTTKTIKIKKISMEIINASKMTIQRIINGSSTKQQGNNNVLEISTKNLSLMFASKSSKCYQRFFIGSSTISQWSNKGTSAFWWLSHYKIQWSLAFESKSSQCHQCFFKESSTNHHWRTNETSMFQRLTKQKS